VCTESELCNVMTDVSRNELIEAREHLTLFSYDIPKKFCSCTIYLVVIGISKTFKYYYFQNKELLVGTASDRGCCFCNVQPEVNGRLSASQGKQQNSTLGQVEHEGFAGVRADFAWAA
jgi:hypothetical protein